MAASNLIESFYVENQNNLFSVKIEGTEDSYVSAPSSLPDEVIDNTMQEKLLSRGKRKATITERPSIRRKVFSKKFRKEWLDEPLFKGWLQPVPSKPERGYCTVCNVILIAGHSELEKHASGKKHCELLHISTIQSLDCPNDGRQFVLIDEGDPMDNDNSRETAMNMSELVADGDFVYFQNGTILPQNRLSSKINPERTSLLKSNMPKVGLLKSSKPSGDKVIATAQLLGPETRARSLPDNPDTVKLLDCLNSDTEDDESIYDLEDSTHLLREMRAELAYTEKKRNEELFSSKDTKDKNPSSGRPKDFEEYQRYLAEKEMEAKLNLIEERRKQNLNIYKLKLIEMELKVRLADGEVQRAEEIHRLRVAQLTKQLNCADDVNFGGKDLQ